MWTECRVNVRENQRVRNYALYLMLTVDLNGQKDAASHLARPNRGSEILALRADRVAEPWGERHLQCLCGWAGRLTRSHKNGLSADAGASVHGASDAQLVALRLTQAHESDGDRPESYLLRQYRDGGRIQFGTEGSSNGMGSIQPSANRGEPDFPRVIPLFAFPEDIRHP
jgi:hypothetical protein